LTRFGANFGVGTKGNVTDAKLLVPKGIFVPKTNQTNILHSFGFALTSYYTYQERLRPKSSKNPRQVFLIANFQNPPTPLCLKMVSFNYLEEKDSELFFQEKGNVLFFQSA
jgi:hypothetical protein